LRGERGRSQSRGQQKGDMKLHFSLAGKGETTQFTRRGSCASRLSRRRGEASKGRKACDGLDRKSRGCYLLGPARISENPPRAGKRTMNVLTYSGQKRIGICSLEGGRLHIMTQNEKKKPGNLCKRGGKRALMAEGQIVVYRIRLLYH